MRQIAFFAATGICIAMVAGCAKSPATTESTGVRDGFVACAKPRPDACTMQYDPVCGDLTDGTSNTYSNACAACSDRNVMRYRAGACSNVGNDEQTQER